MLKHINKMISVEAKVFNKFNETFHGNVNDRNERKLILSTIEKNVQFNNLRHNTFNFCYTNKEFARDEETIVFLPKCFSHINILFNQDKYDIFVVFRSLHFDKNFKYDMTTIKLLILTLNRQLFYKCKNIILVFNNIHTENDIDLDLEIELQLKNETN